ncbi:anthranilate synthase component I family protein [Paenibacillus sp. sgz5001063]|uniref:anthranilate synthase component I family protein n=1 Tax=Paenibacillus sp. sgz5001063 TaxID=3242474 RepID=UPI0036D33BFE
MHPIQVDTEVHDIEFHDPFETYLSLREQLGEQNVYFLETLSGPSKSAQSTLIGFNPLFTITAFATEIQLTGMESIVEQISQGALKAGLLISQGGALHLKERSGLWDFLRFVQSRFNISVPEQGKAFYFGFFGYLGYDTAWSVESLPSHISNDGTVPDLALSLYQGLIEYTLIDKSVRLILNQSADGWDYISKAEICDMFYQGDLQVNQTSADVIEPLSVEYTIDRHAYQNNVKKALSYISAGDIYQVQLGNQINIESHMTPVDVYRRLRVRNPSPYMYLASFGEMTLIGASPELYIKIQSQDITMRPIAGTCPTGSTPEENERFIEALKKDEKEVAEHIMLVDLCRNDIGRVCRTGTLEVEELMVIEKYSHVNHLVSSVSGTQVDSKDMYDIIAATFPAGTMTGAPKIRAMEIIEELETTRRGAYAGAVGFIDFSGYVNMALCIRTAVHRAPHSYAIRASAGVVADSVPEKEWSETFHKMGALFWAITGREVLHESISR